MKREGSVSVGILPLGQSQGRMSPSQTSLSVVQVKMSDKRIFSAGFGPFIKRRPVTSYSDHHSFAPSPSARVKSAAINMPRSHVSVARFYDWTEDLGECVSVSQFYRDLAAYNKLQNEKMKGKTRAIVNPGRMFLRDKAGLTKGEREIIEGIYRNRCNIGKDESVDDSKEDWHLVKSHKDAWLIGKHFQRSSTNKSDSASDGKSDLASSSPTDSCNICNKTDEGALAPPTTPDPEDKVDSKHLWKRKNPHRNSNGHPLDIVDGNHKHSTKRDNKDQGKKKLYVNVFLPSISGEGIYAPHDSLNSGLSLPPTEGPRHPIFSEHARNIFREKQEKARFSRMNSSSVVHSSTFPITNNTTSE